MTTPVGTIAPNVLLLGDCSTADLAPVAEIVRSLVSSENLREVTTIEGLNQFAEDEWHPDHVVLCQNDPDEFSPTEVSQLLSQFPLARWHCCYGPWCDSDGRTRDLWPLALRIPADIAPSHLRRELSPSSSGTVLPWTASRSEIFEEFAAGSLPQGLRSLRVSVSSPDRAWHDLWLCALRRAGCQILSADEISRAQVLLWDADPWDDEGAGRISALHRKFPQIKVLAALGYYRADVAAQLQSCGAVSVISKLTSLSNALQTLADLSATGGTPLSAGS